MSDREHYKTIEYGIVVLMRGPIEPKAYQIGDKIVHVSYPEKVDLGFSGPVYLPEGLSTFFQVSWIDRGGRTEVRLQSQSFERYAPLQEALDAINALVEAFKLVRVGHSDGLSLRSIGVADTMVYNALLDGKATGILNRMARLNKEQHPWVDERATSDDVHQTTPLALPHIDTDTLPLARRYLRCFGLCERGYHAEALIMAHSILDDLTQETIDKLLHDKGLSEDSARALLIRGIKESRLKIYLGPLLKVLSGNTINELWGNADTAISWLNTTRNEIAHRGRKGTLKEAHWAIFASIKIAAVLDHHKMIDAEFPLGMFRSARVNASWTIGRPPWVPSNEDEVEYDPFDRHCRV
jgi:hypothetical protein